MKKLLAAAFLIIYTGSSKADHTLSDLIIDFKGNQRFHIIFDHTPYQASGSFRLHDIVPGHHYLTIYRNSRYGYSYGQKIFSGPLDIPPSASVFAVADRFGFAVTGITDKFSQNAVAPCSISPYDFEALKRTIESRSFDDTRLQIAQQAAGTGQLTSRHIAELLPLFSFESTRLEFARYAYAFVADPVNYYLTYDQFTFESSVDELIRFIEKS